MDDLDLRQEIAHNFDYFQRSLLDHLARFPGKYALIKSQRVIGFYDSPSEADRVGFDRFRDGLFSIQQVTSQPIELGSYASAID